MLKKNILPLSGKETRFLDNVARVIVTVSSAPPLFYKDCFNIMRIHDERIRFRLKMDLFAYTHCVEKADQISDASFLSGLAESLSSCDVSAWLYNPCVFCNFII